MIPTSFKLQKVSTSRDTTEYLFKGPKGEAITALENLGDESLYGDGYIIKDRCKASSSNTDFDTLTVIASNQAPEITTQLISGTGVQKVTYTTSINYIQKPLESLKNYIPIWNHNLYWAMALGGAELDKIDAYDRLNKELADYERAPSFAKTLEEVKFPFTFAKSEPPNIRKKVEEFDKDIRTYIWYPTTSRTKPGKEYYVYPQPEVREELYFTSKKKAEANLRFAGYIKTPAETFGYNSGEWLCMPDGIRRDGKYYVTTNIYLYADRDARLKDGERTNPDGSPALFGWDRDLYPVAPLTSTADYSEFPVVGAFSTFEAIPDSFKMPTEEEPLT